MVAKLTEADLAARLTDVLERARDGERFVIERDGEVITTIIPPGHQAIAGRELAARLGDLVPPGDGFADDLTEIQVAQTRTSPPEWPD